MKSIIINLSKGGSVFHILILPLEKTLQNNKKKKTVRLCPAVNQPTYLVKTPIM